MPRFKDDDLAYGDIPQRWDRERFERFGRNQYEDDFRFTERDRPGRRDVTVMDRRESSRPGRRWEETDRFFEEDRTRSRPRRRTDRELFGDIDPREVAEMALTPYKRKSITKEELDIDQRGPRPGIIRRQSSLDTFDRRPARYEREKDDYHLSPFKERRRGEDWDDFREVEITREREIHRRRPPRSERSVKEERETKEIEYSKHESSSSSSSSFEEEEVIEKSTRAPSKAPSIRAPSTRAKSVKAKSSRAPSVHESFHETVVEEEEEEESSPPPAAKSVYESIHETAFEESVREERRFKKGKTRMPKRLVRREAIMDLGYPFDEEDDFFVLRIALEKEQIDEVIRISETYKDGEKTKVYRFEESAHESISVPPPPVGERTEIERTEWVNPPTVVGSRSRARSIRQSSPNAKSSISQRSPARTSRSRAPSSPATFIEERKTVLEENRSVPPPPASVRPPFAPPPPQQPPPPGPEFYEERKTIVEERAPSQHYNHGTVVLADREYRTDRDINAEIRALESERRALRLERQADEKRDQALRIREYPRDDVQYTEYYRERSRPREEMVIYERERSPPRNVIRVEKNSKDKRNSKLLAAALATLT